MKFRVASDPGNWGGEFGADGLAVASRARDCAIAQHPLSFYTIDEISVDFADQNQRRFLREFAGVVFSQ